MVLIIDGVERLRMEKELSKKFSYFAPKEDKLHPFSVRGLKFYYLFHKIIKGLATKNEINFCKKYAKEYIDSLKK